MHSSVCAQMLLHRCCTATSPSFRLSPLVQAWKPLGGVPATLGMAAFPSLALDEQDGGRAYLAYSDLSGRGGGKAFVRRFAGGAWRQAGWVGRGP